MNLVRREWPVRFAESSNHLYAGRRHSKARLPQSVQGEALERMRSFGRGRIAGVLDLIDGGISGGTHPNIVEPLGSNRWKKQEIRCKTWGIRREGETSQKNRFK